MGQKVPPRKWVAPFARTWLDMLDSQVVVAILRPQVLALGMQHQRWDQTPLADSQDGAAKDGVEPSRQVTGDRDHGHGSL